MTVTNPPTPITRDVTVRPRRRSNFSRLARYVTVKLATTALTLVVGVYIAVLAINYGGFIDKIFEDQINQALMGIGMNMQGATQEEKAAVMEAAEVSLRQAYRLDEPFITRSIEYLGRGLTFNWRAPAEDGTVDEGTNHVLAAIMEALPYTLLLLGVSIPLMFFTSIFLAMFIARRYGSRIDKLFVTLSPLSAVPNWIHGVLLTVIFAAQLRWLPFGGTTGEFPPQTPLEAMLVLGKHMILPVSAILLGSFFQSVYSWRTFFLTSSNEDYVDVAVAKGLPNRLVQRRYILRPALPYLITSFILTLIGFWQSIIALELFFRWPGIGQLFITAINRTDQEVVMGLVVVFAYLLAFSVFALDIVYALVDPRVTLGNGGKERGTAVTGKRWWQRPAEWIRGLFAPKPQRRPDLALADDDAAPEVKTTDWLQQMVRRLKPTLQEIRRYPTAVFGVAIILLLIGVSIYTIIEIPYGTAVELWRGERSQIYHNPRTAPPAWINLFRLNDLPQTIVQNSADGSASKEVVMLDDEIQDVTYTFTFDFPYDALPQDFVMLFTNSYEEKRPYLEMTWFTPDGREIELRDFSLSTSEFYYYVPLDKELQASLQTNNLLATLFLPPEATGASARPVQGSYRLKINALLFEPDANLDVEMILYGKVHGLAGTDHLRRDLTTAMLWGAPVALAFGLVGAFATTLLTMLIAAVGTWLGGWVDELVQRLTEVNMILPVLPIAIMVYYIYAKSIWVILGVLVLLNIFSSMLKNYRAVFLQVKQLPYIEAAQAYGASNRRIVLRYLIPRILPILVPQLVILIPGYVFLEATLAYLGVSDIYLPTWGKVLYEGLTMGAFNGRYFWVLEPIVLLLLTGFAFAAVGFALDRILNPRLRSD